MVATWVTMHTSPNPECLYGETVLNSKVKAKTTRFVDGGFEKRHMYIHRAVLTGLTPGHKYRMFFSGKPLLFVLLCFLNTCAIDYKCGDTDLGYYNPVYTFTALRNGTDWSPRLAVYGDLGDVNDKSVPFLKKDVLNGMFDAILHVGDFAYDMQSVIPVPFSV